MVIADESGGVNDSAGIVGVSCHVAAPRSKASTGMAVMAIASSRNSVQLIISLRFSSAKICKKPRVKKTGRL